MKITTVQLTDVIFHAQRIGKVFGASLKLSMTRENMSMVVDAKE